MARTGRPTKYNKNFHPDDYIRLCRNGMTLAEICLEWNVWHSSIYKWRDEHPEFSSAIKEGNKLREAWWIKVGKKLMLEKRAGGSAYWIFFMKNVCKWQEKSETEIQNEADAAARANAKFLTPDERRELISIARNKKTN